MPRPGRQGPRSSTVRGDWYERARAKPYEPVVRHQDGITKLHLAIPLAHIFDRRPLQRQGRLEVEYVPRLNDHLVVLASARPRLAHPSGVYGHSSAALCAALLDQGLAKVLLELVVGRLSRLDEGQRLLVSLAQRVEGRTVVAVPWCRSAADKEGVVDLTAVALEAAGDFLGAELADVHRIAVGLAERCISAFVETDGKADDIVAVRGDHRCESRPPEVGLSLRPGATGNHHGREALLVRLHRAANSVLFFPALHQHHFIDRAGILPPFLDRQEHCAGQCGFQRLEQRDRYDTIGVEASAFELGHANADTRAV